ncbi:MAG: hypothetical protein H6907_20990 [Hyphomicrobiales bacterium]|nr:hypothetical protein [Hyphomicrobiales bacterium]
MPEIVLLVPTNVPDDQKPWVIDQWCKDNCDDDNECAVVMDIPRDSFHCTFRFADADDMEKFKAEWGRFAKT